MQKKGSTKQPIHPLSQGGPIPVEISKYICYSLRLPQGFSLIHSGQRLQE